MSMTIVDLSQPMHIKLVTRPQCDCGWVGKFTTDVLWALEQIDAHEAQHLKYQQAQEGN